MYSKINRLIIDKWQNSGEQETMNESCEKGLVKLMLKLELILDIFINLPLKNNMFSMNTEPCLQLNNL